ncbi:MAG TPA: acyltransferase [Flavobacteriales bacterium]
MPPTTPDRVSFPRLDAVRALCFLAIFLFHSFHTERPELLDHPLRVFLRHVLLNNGSCGVNVFFVLSGFLITYLLFRERERFERIDVPRFWLRRVLRIWPLYFACVAFGFGVMPLLKAWAGETSTEGASLPLFLTFLSNFDPVDPDASNLRVLWSIAVEEQFYLFWPLIVWVVPQRRARSVFGALLLLSIVIRIVRPDGWDLHKHTLACLCELSMGALTACAAFDRTMVERMRTWTTRTALFPLAVFAVLFVLGHRIEHWSEVGYVVQRPLFAATVAFLLLFQCFARNSALLLPEGGLLARAGRISYGLYCLHPIGALIVIQLMQRWGADRNIWQVVLLQPVLALMASWLLAELSFRFLEGPFLRLKERFAYAVR